MYENANLGGRITPRLVDERLVPPGDGCRDLPGCACATCAGDRKRESRVSAGQGRGFETTRGRELRKGDRTRASRSPPEPHAGRQGLVRRLAAGWLSSTGVARDHDGPASGSPGPSLADPRTARSQPHAGKPSTPAAAGPPADRARPPRRTISPPWTPGPPLTRIAVPKRH